MANLWYCIWFFLTLHEDEEFFLQSPSHQPSDFDQSEQGNKIWRSTAIAIGKSGQKNNSLVHSHLWSLSLQFFAVRRFPLAQSLLRVYFACFRSCVKTRPAAPAWSLQIDSLVSMLVWKSQFSFLLKRAQLQMTSTANLAVSKCICLLNNATTLYFQPIRSVKCWAWWSASRTNERLNALMLYFWEFSTASLVAFVCYYLVQPLSIYM